jgi:hypothetical protein
MFTPFALVTGLGFGFWLFGNSLRGAGQLLTGG